MKLFLPLMLITLVSLIPASLPTRKNSRKERELHLNFRMIPQILFHSIKIVDEVSDMWNFLLEHSSSDFKNNFFKEKDYKIFELLLEVSSRLTDLEKQVNSMAHSTATILQAFPKILKLEFNIHELTLIQNQINFAFDQMSKYLIFGYENKTAEEKNIPITKAEINFFGNENDSELYELHFKKNEMPNNIMKREDPKWSVERFTLEDFAIWATSHSYNALPSLLRRMNDIIAPQENQGLFDLIKALSQEMTRNLCNLEQSPHQTLYNLYNTIAVADLKGFTILQFSYMILKMFHKGNFTTEAEISRSNYEKYTRQKIEAIQRALSNASRFIQKCDPNQYVENISYTKLTKLLQGYIENEVNLNPYGTCRENCRYYTYTKYNGCFKNKFCAEQPECKGKVVECRYVQSDMNICTSSNSERRYEWIEYENGKILGNKGACEKKNLFKVDSWWRYLFWHCSYCLCLCDDINRESDRYFNLRDVTSDIKQNKIVTGVRIVKQNQIIHMQIQQGILNSLGVVNKTSLSWKPVDNYTVYDDNVENSVDYHTMTWLERSIDTDEIYGPPEHVVTGLRFRKIGTHLNLEVRITPINFTTGEVFSADHSYWLGNDNTDASLNNRRTEIKLRNPDIPIRNGPHILDSNHNQYIQFQQTSFDTDAGQSTVPYLDSQALTSQGFPLSGIGLIHRGKLGSGGFIAPTLITYDFLPHLSFSKNI